MADIGSLVIKLAAETAEFQEDMGKTARFLEQHAEGMKSNLEKVAEVAKTAFAIAVGVESVEALKELVMHTLETAAALQHLSEQTGASAEALSGFAPVATISGTAMDQIGVGLTKLSKGLAGVDDETKGATQALAFLGIKAKDAGGNLRDPAEVMNDIALKLPLVTGTSSAWRLASIPNPRSGVWSFGDAPPRMRQRLTVFFAHAARWKLLTGPRRVDWRPSLCARTGVARLRSPTSSTSRPRSGRCLI